MGITIFLCIIAVFCLIMMCDKDKERAKRYTYGLLMILFVLAVNLMNR